MTKLILISELLSFPIDEGARVVAFSLMNEFQKKAEIISITSQKNDIHGLRVIGIPLPKLFINRELFLLLKKQSQDTILYIPEASCTINSFLRAGVLKLFSHKSKIALLGVQYRRISMLLRCLCCFFKPDVLFLSSHKHARVYEDFGMRTHVLSPAIDHNKYCRIDDSKKSFLRNKYKLLPDKRVALHVGHIKNSRNLCWLIPLQKVCDFQVIVVGSTATEVEKYVRDSLIKEGIVVIDAYQPNIEELYQLSDLYVFPVLRKDAAIDMPLSVLEAMACNLPVVTTRFGGLVDHFKEDKDFRYFDTQEQLIQIVKEMQDTEVNNAKKVASFTWGKLADEILSACESLK